jgi:hypothetical protein
MTRTRAFGHALDEPRARRSARIGRCKCVPKRASLECSFSRGAAAWALVGGRARFRDLRERGRGFSRSRTDHPRWRSSVPASCRTECLGVMARSGGRGQRRRDGSSRHS